MATDYDDDNDDDDDEDDDDVCALRSSRGAMPRHAACIQIDAS